MKKRKKQRNRAQYGQNRHHLLFQGRHWNTGMAKELRNAFVYMLDINIHNELHNELLNDVPKPPPDALKPLYLAFLAQRQEINQLDIIGATEWLLNACDDPAFKASMKRQHDFLAKKLK